MCRVEFFKISKRDVTFIREMRVERSICILTVSYNWILRVGSTAAVQLRHTFCYTAADLKKSYSRQFQFAHIIFGNCDGEFTK